MEKQRIGLLIIHGIGEQDVLDTLDTFTRNLVNSLQQTSRSQIKLTHNRMPLPGNIDDYVQLSFIDDPSVEIDVHEYYWAHKMERMISYSEVLDWLQQASNGAQTFYDENEELSRRYEQGADGKFKKHWYLKKVGWLFRALHAVGRATSLILPAWLDPILRMLLSKPAEGIIDYIGDVAIYTSSDRKSKFYQARQQVLNGAIEKIAALLRQDYDRIVVVGHSLGTVIAYDALNAVNLLMNEDPELAAQHDKLFELITLGSPLDKVAFFFREHIPKDSYVKQLILNNVHGFRRRGLVVPLEGDAELVSNVRNFLSHMQWTNYWDAQDPVSGHLDFYDNVVNVQVDNGQRWGVAHSGYWYNLNIYREVIARAQAHEVVSADEQAS
ncbi:MAG: hypothetical protein WCC10_03470 [Tumebacillaceae bacterium]